MESLSSLGRVVMWGAVILAAVFVPQLSFVSGAGPYTVPPVSRVIVELPASSVGPKTHVVCLVRSEPAGSQVSQRMTCYLSYFGPVPPPPPPLMAADHIVLTVGLDAVRGNVSGDFLPCTEFIPDGLDAQIDFTIQLDKAGGPGSGSVTFTVDTTAPFDCADGAQSTGPLTLTPLPQGHDEDYWATGQTAPDGCSTWEELGASQTQGGLRDPFNFWDFFDTPDASNLRDRAISVGDISRVQDRFGANDQNKAAPINRNTDPLSAPPPTGYHPAFDRGATLGPNAWNVDAPDGAISVGDVSAVIAQFGHSCIAAP